MADKNYRLVYSTDGSHKPSGKRGGEPFVNEKVIEKVIEVVPSEITIKLRLETKGRGGKAVSVLFNLPHNPAYFTKLCKKLKSHCGSGGSYKEGNIEIQGDHREKLRTFLQKRGFQVKLAGG